MATATINVVAVNDPPTADAGPNQNVAQGALVQLTGAASSDPESQPLTYAWTLTGKPTGSTAVLSSSTIVNPTFTADLAGAYTARLIVNDGALPSAPAFVTITAANGLPTVSVVATTANANEAGPVNGLFTITRSGGNLAASLSVSAVISGTATNGGDYAVINTPFSIPANQTSVTVPVNVFKDNIVEPTETVVLTISSNAAYTIGTGSATVTIADDPAIVSVAATTANANEAGPVNGLFTITRSGGNLAAALSVSAGSAGRRPTAAITRSSTHRSRSRRTDVGHGAGDTSSRTTSSSPPRPWC